MKMHANARLSLKGRELLIDRVENAGWSLMTAAEAAGISDRTARKWLARYRAEGADGLLDRSSAPRRVANRTEDGRVEVIAALRRAYAAIYRDSDERTAALAGWLDFYNRRRPHGALSHKPPIARLNELNNLLGSYT
jgi:transposase InsO family protein